NDEATARTHAAPQRVAARRHAQLCQAQAEIQPRLERVALPLAARRAEPSHQALRDSIERKLLVVARCTGGDETSQKRPGVGCKLGVEGEQVVVLRGSAKSFLEQQNLAQLLSEHMPEAADAAF